MGGEELWSNWRIQNMPSAFVKKLDVATPDKVGRFLGQKCANTYAFSEGTPKGNPLSIAQITELINKLEAHKDKPGVTSNIAHELKITGMTISCLCEGCRDG